MITISTFNIQNDISKFSKEKVDIVWDYLQKNQIDIFNLQEVYSTFDKAFSKKIKELSYHKYGTFRFTLKRIFNRINEKTPIITRYPVLSHRTYHLPFLPSLLKRVMTKVVVQIEGKEVSIYNTHIDYLHEITKKRQLKRILKILKKDTNPIILTGDFNLKNNKVIFQEFIQELKELGIMHIDAGEKTFKASAYHRAIDHVFLSKEFRVMDIHVVQDIPVSDHFPVLIHAEFVK